MTILYIAKRCNSNVNSGYTQCKYNTAFATTFNEGKKMEARKEKKCSARADEAIKALKKIGIFFLVTFCFIVLIVLISHFLNILVEDQPSWVKVNAWEKTGNDPGGIFFHVINHWGKGEVILVDHGYDGTIDKVKIVGCSQGFDPNSPNWEMWVERYYEARLWATTGKPPDPNT